MDQCSDVLVAARDEFTYNERQSFESNVLDFLYTAKREEFQRRTSAGLSLLLPTQVGPIPLQGNISNEAWSQLEQMRQSLSISNIQREDLIHIFSRSANSKVVDDWLACVREPRAGLTVANEIAGTHVHIIELRYIKPLAQDPDVVEIAQVTLNGVPVDGHPASIQHNALGSTTFRFIVDRLARDTDITISTKSLGDITRVLPRLVIPTQTIWKLDLIWEYVIPSTSTRWTIDPQLGVQIGAEIHRVYRQNAGITLSPQGSRVNVNQLWLGLINTDIIQIDISVYILGIGTVHFASALIGGANTQSNGWVQLNDVNYNVPGFGNFPGLTGQVGMSYRVTSPDLIATVDRSPSGKALKWSEI